MTQTAWLCVGSDYAVLSLPNVLWHACTRISSASSAFSTIQNMSRRALVTQTAPRVGGTYTLKTAWLFAGMGAPLLERACASVFPSRGTFVHLTAYYLPGAVYEALPRLLPRIRHHAALLLLPTCCTCTDCFSYVTWVAVSAAGHHLECGTAALSPVRSLYAALPAWMWVAR